MYPTRPDHQPHPLFCYHWEELEKSQDTQSERTEDDLKANGTEGLKKISMRSNTDPFTLCSRPWWWWGGGVQVRDGQRISLGEQPLGSQNSRSLLIRFMVEE